MYTKTFGMTKTYSIIVSTLKILHIIATIIKKVPGKFKDECHGQVMVEFVGLRSKMYSYVKDNEKGGRTVKGIKRTLLRTTSNMKTIKTCY